jgi:hypothetical protein
MVVALTSVADAKSVTLEMGPGDVVAQVLKDRGTCYVVNLAVPDEVSGARLDTVLLEFYVDVAADTSVEGDYTPSLDVYPLTEEHREGQEPRFATNYPSSRAVLIGADQHVLIDIIDIVNGWIASPGSNHGLVVGSFSTPKAGGLNMRNDRIGSGKLARVTFFYQNRFGQPVPSSQ